MRKVQNGMPDREGSKSIGWWVRDIIRRPTAPSYAARRLGLAPFIVGQPRGQETTSFVLTSRVSISELLGRRRIAVMIRGSWKQGIRDRRWRELPMSPTCWRR